MSAAAPEVVDAPVAAAPAIPQVFYKISSIDGTVFRVERRCLEMSKTLMDCVTNLGYTADNIEEKDPIPLSNVSKEIFELVHKYLEHHMNDTPRAEGAEVVISAWDENFLNMDGDQMFDLINAANFLDIKGLLDVACKTVANMIKGKSPEEMRQIWMIPTDEEDEAREAALAAAEAAAAEAEAAAEAAATADAATTASTSADN